VVEAAVGIVDDDRAGGDAFLESDQLAGNRRGVDIGLDLLELRLGRGLVCSETNWTSLAFGCFLKKKPALAGAAKSVAAAMVAARIVIAFFMPVSPFGWGEGPLKIRPGRASSRCLMKRF
jgi:hypothetical protein